MRTYSFLALLTMRHKDSELIMLQALLRLVTFGIMLSVALLLSGLIK